MATCRAPNLTASIALASSVVKLSSQAGVLKISLVPWTVMSKTSQAPIMIRPMSGLSFLARFCQTDSQFGQFAARSWCSPLRLLTRPSRKPQPSMVSSLNATYLLVSLGTFSSSVMPCESPNTETFGTVPGGPTAGGVVGDPDGRPDGDADADGTTSAP